jgi:hypothetical protein
LPKKRHELESLESLRIEIDPSFDDEESFSLSGTADKGTGEYQYILGYKCSISGPRMGTVKGQVQLSPAQTKAIFAICQNMNIGLFPDSAAGCDGTTTKVTITQGWNKLEMEFWPEAPEPWKPVERIIGMLRQIVNDAINAPKI